MKPRTSSSVSGGCWMCWSTPPMRTLAGRPAWMWMSEALCSTAKWRSFWKSIISSPNDQEKWPLMGKYTAADEQGENFGRFSDVGRAGWLAKTDMVYSTHAPTRPTGIHAATRGRVHSHVSHFAGINYRRGHVGRDICERLRRDGGGG